MPIDYTALAAELNSDPNAYGYSARLAAGDDQGIAELLNARRSGITVREESVSSKTVWEAISVSDYTALPATPSAAQLSTERRYLAWLSGLAAIATIRLLNDDGTDTPVVANLKAMFPTSTGTFTRLSALASRQGSRAEQLFGRGTAVTSSDVARALRG